MFLSVTKTADVLRNKTRECFFSPNIFILSLQKKEREGMQLRIGILRCEFERQKKALAKEMDVLQKERAQLQKKGSYIYPKVTLATDILCVHVSHSTHVSPEFYDCSSFLPSFLFCSFTLCKKAASYLAVHPIFNALPSHAEVANCDVRHLDDRQII